MSPATARSTWDGLMLNPGDHIVLLPGRYGAMTLTASGTQQCPLLIVSGGDGGVVITDTLEIDSRDVVVRELTFSGAGNDDVHMMDAARVTLDHVHFRARGATNRFPGNFDILSCTDCGIVDSDFDSVETGLGGVEVGSTGFVFRGNLVHMNDGNGIDVHANGVVIAGNDWSGVFHDIYFSLQPDSLFTRNLLHDVTAKYIDKDFLKGGVVRSNTFAGIYGSQQPLAKSMTRFEDNLVTLATPFSGDPLPLDGGFNLFDTSVTVPYANTLPDGGLVSGTDRIAAVHFDVPSYVPPAGSPEIDAADPALPVPPGGGSRADIGAFERGASFANGRYCILDGGS
jgi:hypothetical protein